MKKIKSAFIATAILVGIGGAFAFSPKPCQDCRYEQQYWYNGSMYVPTGTFGVNYGCVGTSGTCNYYWNGSGYAPCRIGGYTPF